MRKCDHCVDGVVKLFTSTERCEYCVGTGQLPDDPPGSHPVDQVPDLMSPTLGVPYEKGKLEPAPDIGHQSLDALKKLNADDELKANLVGYNIQGAITSRASSTDPSVRKSDCRTIKLSHIVPTRCRTSETKDLQEDIAANGVMNPISVREYYDVQKGDSRFVLLAGARRVYACIALGHETIPALVRKSKLQLGFEQIGTGKVPYKEQEAFIPANWVAEEPKTFDEGALPDLMAATLVAPIPGPGIGYHRLAVLKQLKLISEISWLVDNNIIGFSTAYSLARMDADDQRDWLNMAEKHCPDIRSANIKLQFAMCRNADIVMGGLVPKTSATVPAILSRGEFDAKEQPECNITSSIQRLPTKPIDEAKVLRLIISRNEKLSVSSLATLIKKPESFIRDRLLLLPGGAWDGIKGPWGDVDVRRAMLRCANPEKIEKLTGRHTLETYCRGQIIAGALDMYDAGQISLHDLQCLGVHTKSYQQGWIDAKMERAPGEK